MLLLSIDASGKSAACAVTDAGKVICSEFINSGLTHSQTLLPMVDKMLKDASVDIKDIDAFAITNGPGSFTGLRIGMSFVMGLAGSKPCYPVPTLLALAHNVSGQDAIVIPAMDARRNQVYTAVFECKGDKIYRLEEDMAIPVSEVVEKFDCYKGRKIIIIGDGAYLFEDIIKDCENVSLGESGLIYPLGESVAKAAQNISPVNASELKLNYLRLSQAERELKEKSKK